MSLRTWAAAASTAMAVTTGCSSGPSGPVVAVTATDSECRVATASLDAGAHTFEVRNAGGQVTEVYVYGPGDKVITERENIGPGTTARFGVTLVPGSYEVACKPGQKGSGIRQPLTVAAKR